jgi:hypothetical protein
MPRVLIAVLAVAGVLSALALAVVGPWDSAPDEEAADISLETLEQRMLEALTSGDDVLYVRKAHLYESGEYERDLSFETWIDGSTQSLRLRDVVEPQSPPLPQISDRIIVNATGYYIDTAGAPQTFPQRSCPEARRLPLAEYLVCAQTGDEITSRAVITEHPDGRRMLAIKWEGERQGSDSTISFTRYLYIDPDTYEPLASVEHGTDRMQGTSDRYTITEQFTHEFVPRDSLPADFFEPASIGFLESAP